MPIGLSQLLYRKQESQTSPDITSAPGEVSSDYAAWKAFDGDSDASGANNFLDSDQTSLPYYVQIELENPMAFQQADIYCAHPEFCFNTLEILVSDNGTDWTSVLDPVDVSWSEYGENQNFYLSPDKEYKYYRFQNTTDPDTNEKLQVLEIDLWFQDTNPIPLHFLDKRSTPYFTNIHYFSNKRQVDPIHIHGVLDKRPVAMLSLLSFLDTRDINTGYSVLFSDKRRIVRDITITKKMFDVRKIETEQHALRIERVIV